MEVRSRPERRGATAVTDDTSEGGETGVSEERACERIELPPPEIEELPPPEIGVDSVAVRSTMSSSSLES